MALNIESTTGLIFLFLYGILLDLLVLGYIFRRLGWHSRWSLLLFHVSIRLGAQATGVAFGYVGYSNIGLLMAYFILGAEGYFTLILCLCHFLVHWHYNYLLCRDSWIEPRLPESMPIRQRFLAQFTVFDPNRTPLAMIHVILTLANAMVIVGGSLVANPKDSAANLPKAESLRASGQVVFVCVHVFLLYCVVCTLCQCKRERGRIHPTLWLILTAWSLLFVRGLYGILAAVVPSFNYYNPGKYTEYGVAAEFVTTEYLMATAIEWFSCALLMITYITSRKPIIPDSVQLEMVQGGSGAVEGEK